MKAKAGIDNYGLYPLGLSPMEVLQWAHIHGAEGVAFSGLDREKRDLCTPSYLKELAAYAQQCGLYLEWGGGQHIPRDLENWGRKEISGINRKAAAEAGILGVRIIRSCSGGLMRWKPGSIPTIQLMEETAGELSRQLQMLRDYRVILALETHFEFTTFELLKIFDWCGVQPGDCLGICLDTMNLLTMLENPLMAAERVLPWVVSTHIKDGGLKMTDEGLQSFPCRLGSGIVDLKAIINLIRENNAGVNFSVEDHGGDFDIPIFNSEFLNEFPDLQAAEMISLFELAKKTERLMEEGRCSITGRSEWPQVCGERMAGDISVLKDIINGTTS